MKFSYLLKLQNLVFYILEMWLFMNKDTGQFHKKLIKTTQTIHLFTNRVLHQKDCYGDLWNIFSDI